MSWMRFALTVLIGGVVTSLTDWLFMGDLLYKRFNKYPEIWRVQGKEAESKAIAWSSPLPFLTCAVFALACAQLHLHTFAATLKLACEIWVIAPLPWMITTSLWMKVQPMIAAAYSLGWLVKLVLAATAVNLIMR